MSDRLENGSQHKCELCEERTSETLTCDSHPRGVNHLVCEVCAL